MAGTTGTLTATIVDSRGIIWTNAIITATFRPSPFGTGKPVWAGGPLDFTLAAVTSDGNGFFSITLPANTTINPAGSMWTLAISPDASFASTIINLSVNVGIIDISALITAGIHDQKTIVDALPVPRVYNPIEARGIPPLNFGSLVADTTARTLRYWDGTTWHALSTNTGQGFVQLSPGVAQTISQPAGTNFAVSTTAGGVFLYNGNQVATSVDIASVNSSITNVSNSLATTNANVSTITGEIATLNNNVNANNNSIATLNSEVATLNSEVAGKQNALGFTPVQQGTGIGQILTNVVKIGWGGNTLDATVDNTNLGAFLFNAPGSNSLAQNGYYTFTGGLILQWGRMLTDINAGELLVSFPIAFPTQCFSVVVSTYSTTDRITYVALNSIATSGFTIGNNGSSGFATWFAIGN